MVSVGLMSQCTCNNLKNTETLYFVCCYNYSNKKKNEWYYKVIKNINLADYVSVRMFHNSLVERLIYIKLPTRSKPHITYNINQMLPLKHDTNSSSLNKQNRYIAEKIAPLWLAGSRPIYHLGFMICYCRSLNLFLWCDRPLVLCFQKVYFRFFVSSQICHLCPAWIHNRPSQNCRQKLFWRKLDSIGH